MSPHDIMIRMRMPDRAMLEVNEQTLEYGHAMTSGPLFRAQREKTLWPIFAAESDSVCPLEEIYAQLKLNPKPVSQLIALKFPSSEHHQLLKLHAKLDNDDNILLRLLPFPSTMPLRIIEGGRKFAVEVPGILYQEYTAAANPRQAIIDLLPEIWKKIDADHDLKLAENLSGIVDRDRYFKLHIPLEDLESEDVCFGWLPMDRPYRDIRHRVRDEMCRG